MVKGHHFLAVLVKMMDLHSRSQAKPKTFVLDIFVAVDFAVCMGMLMLRFFLPIWLDRTPQ